jgi:hypothetical protein
VEIGGGYTEFVGFAVVHQNHWVTRLSHKTEAEDSTRRFGQPRPVQLPRSGGQTAWAGQIARAGLTAQWGRSDRSDR